MAQQDVTRKLAAILAADAVGYSRLMGLDEEAALADLAERRSVIDELIESHGGRVFGAAGDSVVAEFPSSVEAARCAIEVQDRLRVLNADVPDERRMGDQRPQCLHRVRTRHQRRNRARSASER